MPSKSSLLPNETITYCNECHTNPGKPIRFIDAPVCVQCSELPKYNFITKTDAKNEYLVKDEDLNGLVFHQVKSSYGRNAYASLYNKLDIMQKACERYSTTLEELSGVLEINKQEKQNKSAARRMKMQENRNAREAPRRNQLIDNLRVAGLELRADSKLCQMYIEGKIDNLAQVVRRMCEIRYLYEYCHMDECRNAAYQQMREELAILGHSNFSVQDMAEEIALRKYAGGRYPAVFPWQ